MAGPEGQAGGNQSQVKGFSRVIQNEPASGEHGTPGGSQSIESGPNWYCREVGRSGRQIWSLWKGYS